MPLSESLSLGRPRIEERTHLIGVDLRLKMFVIQQWALKAPNDL